MKPRLWLVLGMLTALVVAIVAGTTLFNASTSPKAYVAKHFSRASRLDSSGAKAYTSRSRPSAVATRIVGKWKPVSQYADGSGVYLRYSGDAIVIQPRGTGSVILVDKASRVYRRYYGRLGKAWGWTSTHGESFRGGGPGEGK